MADRDFPTSAYPILARPLLVQPGLPPKSNIENCRMLTVLKLKLRHPTSWIASEVPVTRAESVLGFSAGTVLGKLIVVAAA